MAGTHRVDASRRAEWYRTFPEAIQFGIVRREYRCALRQGFVVDTPITFITADASSVSAFPNRERIALG